jgi:hypothetical protein
MSEKITEDDLNALLKEQYAAWKGQKPIVREVEMGPGYWHGYDKDGKLKAIYGDDFREAMKKLSDEKRVRNKE